jgi:hypothetical protein
MSSSKRTSRIAKGSIVHNMLRRSLGPKGCTAFQGKMKRQAIWNWRYSDIDLLVRWQCHKCRNAACPRITSELQAPWVLCLHHLFGPHLAPKQHALLAAQMHPGTYVQSRKQRAREKLAPGAKAIAQCWLGLCSSALPLLLMLSLAHSVYGQADTAVSSFSGEGHWSCCLLQQAVMSLQPGSCHIC